MQLDCQECPSSFLNNFCPYFKAQPTVRPSWKASPSTPMPSWVGYLAHSILLITVDFPLCDVIVYLSNIYIRGRNWVLSFVFLGHNTCISPSISAIWVSDELARASLQKTLLWLWRWKEVCVCLNLVAYQLPHSLDRTSSKVILIKKKRSSFSSWSAHIVISLLPED